jgi:uncharacterized protein YlxW (UPF0749 family)
MRAWVAQISLSLVAVVIGVLLVGQLRSQARPLELSSLSAQELSTLVESLRVRNVDLGDGLADLREQIREYELRDVDGQSNLAIGEEDLERISAFAGLRAVRGQGIEMEIEGSFDPQAVNDLIYELRNSGADAIAVNDIRITARSVAVLGTGAIEIDGVPIGRSFTITAIGSPDGLEAALQRPGGILVLLQQSIEARFVITKSQELEVPATERDLAPQAARAVE